MSDYSDEDFEMSASGTVGKFDAAKPPKASGVTATNNSKPRAGAGAGAKK